MRSRGCAIAGARWAWSGALALAFVCAGAVTAYAQNLPIQVEQSQAVGAVSVDVDLRTLPKAPEWKPGDPIVEIPLRRKPAANGLEFTPAQPQLDPLLGAQAGVGGPSSQAFSTPVVNVTGQGYSGVNPPDPSGAAGPNHYIQMINGSGGALYKVYDKTGATVAGPTSLDTLGSGSCANGLGDPIALYDRLADRFLLTEFASLGNHLCVYVSKTSNPVTGGWWAYDFSVSQFPDYPKYGVWPTAYFVGTNESSPALYALDRTKMLSGLAATFIRLTGPVLAGFGFQMITPASFDGVVAPPVGSPGWFVRHRDDEVHNVGSNNPSVDYLDLFAFTPNFTTPGSSTLVGPTSIAIASIDSDLCGLTSFSCIPQPGTTVKLDPLREVVMQPAQYRNDVGGHETMIGSLATDVTGTNQAGVRWFELRRSGGGAWTLFQEGTYSPNSTNRWMSSAAMDKSGGVAVAYSVSSSSVNPGLKYTGRLASAPAGTLPEAETTIVNGVGFDSSNRYGDYHHLAIDPADDCTFWFTGMRAASGQWSTQIAAFKFDSCGSGGVCTDGDGDGYGDPGDASCPNGSATDCNDSNASVNPGATEIPGNGIDDDCNPATPDSSCADLDGDGYGNPGHASCPNGSATDCNDSSAAVNPGATEIPGNGIDDDCNAATSDCKDLDGDGYGNPASPACTNASLDCNDSNANVNPGRTEIPGNGIDDDCNSATPGGCSQP